MKMISLLVLCFIATNTSISPLLGDYLNALRIKGTVKQLEWETRQTPEPPGICPQGSIILGLCSGPMLKSATTAQELATDPLDTDDIRDLMDYGVQNILQELLHKIPNASEDSPPTLVDLFYMVNHGLIGFYRAKFLLLYLPCTRYIVCSTNESAKPALRFLKQIITNLIPLEAEEAIQALFHSHTLAMVNHANELRFEYPQVFFLPTDADNHTYCTCSGGLRKRYKQVSRLENLINRSEIFLRFISTHINPHPNSPHSLIREFFILPKSVVKKYIDIYSLYQYMEYLNCNSVKRETFMQVFPKPMRRHMHGMQYFETNISNTMRVNDDILENLIETMNRDKLEICQVIQDYMNKDSMFRKYLINQLDKPQNLLDALRDSDLLFTYYGLTRVTKCLNLSNTETGFKAFINSFNSKHQELRDICQSMGRLGLDVLILMTKLSIVDLFEFCNRFDELNQAKKIKKYKSKAKSFAGSASSLAEVPGPDTPATNAEQPALTKDYATVELCDYATDEEVFYPQYRVYP